MGDVREVEPAEARELLARGATLVDVRDAGEVLAGLPGGALHVPRCELQARLPALLAGREATLLLICASGVRSRAAAADLAGHGWTGVASVAGGFERWRREGHPVTLPAGAEAGAERYARQLALPEVGLEGQRRLARARVLLIGAGGLGSPAALYLAAAGVGRITLLDDDRVERSNLQRQVLHRDADVGTAKAQSGAATLRAINPQVEIDVRESRLEAGNARDLLSGQQVVLDGSDNFATRYAASDACVALGIPCVHGSVFRFEGQVSVFWPGRGGGPCYRCLYPEPPPPELAPSCAEAGVLGVVPGVIGLLQAAETLKLLLGAGTPLVGRMLHYDALRGGFEEFEVPRDPQCLGCGPAAVPARRERSPFEPAPPEV